MQTVWQALQVRSERRTGQPIRRHSRLAGREAQFWQPFDKTQAGRILTAAERFERATRAKGQRSGRLGSVALEVLRELMRLVDYRTGRLEPAIKTLCDRIRRSRDAVCRALARLRAAGFIDWLRRYEPTGNEGRGVQVQQTSNAYRVTMPPAAAKMIANGATPPPIPDDAAHRAQEAKAERKAMIAALPLWEQPAETVDDPQLAAILSRIARGIVERESAERTEYRQEFNNERR